MNGMEVCVWDNLRQPIYPGNKALVEKAQDPSKRTSDEFSISRAQRRARLLPWRSVPRHFQTAAPRSSERMRQTATATKTWRSTLIFTWQPLAASYAATGNTTRADRDAARRSLHGRHFTAGSLPCQRSGAPDTPPPRPTPLRPAPGRSGSAPNSLTTVRCRHKRPVCATGILVPLSPAGLR